MAEAEAGGNEDQAPAKVLNINVGVMGHVDSGKTSLVRALSKTLSTAALDKHPQSQERGITLDLGFSSFTVPIPDHMKTEAQDYDVLQFTLVDCPGHASLIKTIIGGAQIIDMMILVIDVTKGVQTQTAECLVIGEILMEKILIVLNKIDQIPEETRTEKVEKVKKGLEKVVPYLQTLSCPTMQQVFASTKFKNPDMVAVSATGGSADAPADVLVDKLKGISRFPQRIITGPFYFSVDHCFPIKGKGTVLTGTVLSGSVRVNDEIKSIQMFKKPVNKIAQGDRAGILVTQLDAKLIERGVLATPGSVPSFSAIVASVERVRFFKVPVLPESMISVMGCKGTAGSKRKYHITIGHSTIMATAIFFRQPNLEPATSGADCESGSQWVLLLFEKVVTAPKDSMLIGSLLDTDIHSNTCRIVFFGKALIVMDKDNKDELSRLRLFKPKQKVGHVKRVVDESVVIGKDLFKKETDISKFMNLKITLEKETEKASLLPGYIEGSFGSSGQYKVRARPRSSPAKTPQVRCTQPHGLPVSRGKGKGKAKGEDEDEDTNLVFV
ncbi:hypothetical protein GUITHDRAFT_143832 [Guillardia theta CCMP2712]|uniref:Tr-type G domain-containing protein n=1 Tax=Guillardia theta (strain CCMP2712) TaxID=905079 RepID=L1IT02_GUITC|nr:hypothetical protein GUITHDRAFT_143832 [Guillardia theta CCMP2712]EKX39029.1 hypothetical protein GUITHDRAFT_143832 [Guillardia theta CCMP2712]|eukprot:XP_005826009.1 hypothetical protein GUITHDRAFT_143832 [Guillardia theta CCMP2712]